ncbi:hypothetical protein L3X38_011122 [Prunus dulcis]|uniref:Uncharacterized protein n=1 Tax=Prunus dulcis TaxID=3755 RepID=A0AAD4WJA7_PRUDU|nr:hypothetical protein L3X38_011122 [Prunus dulcis]
MDRPQGALCAQDVEIGKTSQGMVRKGNYNGDYSSRSQNGRTYGGLDLVPVKIRLTTVSCILPERLESTWCHRDLPVDQDDHSPLYPTSLRLG